MKLNKTTIVLLTAGLLTTAVQADDKERGPGKGRPEFRGKGGDRPDRGAALAKALGLNEKQALQMKKLQEDQRAAFGKLMAEIRKSGDREGAREKFGALREEYQKKMRAILTEKQAKKLDEMRKQFQNRGPGKRPEGEGKTRPGKKGREASFLGQQYVLNDDRDEHRGRDHNRDGDRHHRGRDHDRDERGHHGDRDDDRRAEAAERYQKYQQARKEWYERMKKAAEARRSGSSHSSKDDAERAKRIEAMKKAWGERVKQAIEERKRQAASQQRGPQGPQWGGPRPPHGRPHGPRPGFGQGLGPKGPQARGPKWGGPRPPHGRPHGPRPGFGRGLGPKGPQARGPQRGAHRSGFGKPGHRPKGPQIRGKQSHGKPSGCSSCKGSKPGHGSKGPQARGPRPPHGGPKGRPEPHRGHRGTRR